MPVGERQTFGTPGKVCLALFKSLRVKAVLFIDRIQERLREGVQAGGLGLADGVPSSLITLKKICLDWRAAQLRWFLKIPGIKANTGKYFYF